jgi:hypothetical protein
MHSDNKFCPPAAQFIGENALSTAVFIVQTADVVLAMRSHIKAGSWAREAAKSAGTPVYAVKNSADSTLVRALETLLGSAGAVMGSPPAAGAVQYQNHVVAMVSVPYTSPLYVSGPRIGSMGVA